MLPVLHLVLGITKKLWDNLVGDIQCFESTSCLDQKMLAEANENLARYVTELKEKKKLVDEEFKISEAQCSEMYKVYNET